MILKVSSAKWRPFCLGLNVLITADHTLCPNHERSYDMETLSTVLALGEVIQRSPMDSHQQGMQSFFFIIFPQPEKAVDKTTNFPVIWDDPSRPRVFTIFFVGDIWWRHQMETFSALLAICAGNSPVTDEFPAQRPVMRSFDVFSDLCLNKRFSKHSWGWWLETPLHPLWRHSNENVGARHRCVGHG